MSASAHERQKKALDPLLLELREVSFLTTEQSLLSALSASMPLPVSLANISVVQKSLTMVVALLLGQQPGWNELFYFIFT